VAPQFAGRQLYKILGQFCPDPIPHLSMQGGSKVSQCDWRCNQDQVLITLLVEFDLKAIGDALGERSLQFPVRIGPALFGVSGTALGLEAATRTVGHKFTAGRQLRGKVHVIDIDQLCVTRYALDDRYMRAIGYDNPSSVGSHLNGSQALPVGDGGVL